MKGASVLLDAGANADCDPENLAQFAAMGSIYAEKVLGKKFPGWPSLVSGKKKPRATN